MPKYSKQTILDIIELKDKGYSGRQVAKMLGLGKSGVNAVYNQRNAILSEDSKTAKYLFIDLECSPDVAVSFRRFKANISQDNVLQNGGTLLSIAWRWMHEPKAQGLALTPAEALSNNDRRLAATLWALIDEADAVIAHNAANFDIPLLKSRLVVNNLHPLKKVKIIDTLQIARQMKFQSNRLGSLGVILGEGAKAEHSGIKTWIGCMQGNQDSLDEMLAYNLEDVDLLYRVYHRLRQHDKQPLNAGLFANDAAEHSCPVCGSHDVAKTGKLSYTNVSAFEEYECNECHARSRSRFAVNVEARKTLLV